jgi:hypothetical protein
MVLGGVVLLPQLATSAARVDHPSQKYEAKKEKGAENPDDRDRRVWPCMK